MSVVTTSGSLRRLPPGKPDDLIWRCSLDAYHAMLDQGILNDDDAVELVAGWMIHKMPTNLPHSSAVDLLMDALSALLPAGWLLRIQQPVTLPVGDSEPSPDIAIVQGSRSDYVHRHPGPGDVGLIVEVADTTLARDRTLKLQEYARSNVGEYWIVNLADRTIEVHTQPSGDRSDPRYHSIRVYSLAEAVPVVLQGQSLGTITVASVLP